MLKHKTMSSPVGVLKIVIKDQSLVAILWDKERLNRVRLESMEEDLKNPLILEIEQQLNEYFLKKRSGFDLPYELRGTHFQQQVWMLLNQIPFGETRTYKEIALQLNKPDAVRAVGAAIGRNPISIIVPCHRVIATNGSLTGFAGGLDRKKTLLDLESANL
jgi:methylated-DNA-[protein]-cysteine S-methyltransferase